MCTLKFFKNFNGHLVLCIGLMVDSHLACIPVKVTLILLSYMLKIYSVIAFDCVLIVYRKNMYS